MNQHQHDNKIYIIRVWLTHRDDYQGGCEYVLFGVGTNINFVCAAAEQSTSSVTHLLHLVQTGASLILTSNTNFMFLLVFCSY